jgi:kanamycin nucleotidyltransferase
MRGLPPMPLEGTVQDILDGPAPLGRPDRELVAETIVRRILGAHGEAVIAIALYGSNATGRDGPYSDIEIWTAIEDGALPGDERVNHEWVWGAGKAEVNVWSEASIRKWAGEVDERWSLTHGKFVHAVRLFERRAAFIEEIRQLGAAPSAEAIRAVMQEAIVGSLFELLGKLRNAVALKRAGEGPRHFLHFAESAAQLTALAQSYCFASGSTFLEEAAALTGPSGYAELIALARSGVLADPLALAQAADAYWAGLAKWIELIGLDLAGRCRAGL